MSHSSLRVTVSHTNDSYGVYVSIYAVIYLEAGWLEEENSVLHITYIPMIS